MELTRQTQCIVCRNRTRVHDPPLAEEFQVSPWTPGISSTMTTGSYFFYVVSLPTLSKSKLAKDSNNDSFLSTSWAHVRSLACSHLADLQLPLHLRHTNHVVVFPDRNGSPFSVKCYSTSNFYRYFQTVEHTVEAFQKPVGLRTFCLSWIWRVEIGFLCFSCYIEFLGVVSSN